MEILGLPAGQVVGAVLIVAMIAWGFISHKGNKQGGGDSSGGGGSSSPKPSTPPAETTKES